MTRSEFLQKLIASLVIGKLPLNLTRQFRKIYLLQCFIAGFRYYEGMQYLSGMKKGDLLELIREPDNEYDSCAVALHWRGKKIGFIPADTNEMLSYLLDAQALSLFGVITHLELSAKPWENVAMAVYFLQEADKNLPAHADYLTRIEAPHYRTLRNGKQTQEMIEADYERLFETSERVINLDTIPLHQNEARKYYEKWYGKYAVPVGSGRYLKIKDDGIYTFMYEIDERISSVEDIDGNRYLEFFLV